MNIYNVLIAPVVTEKSLGAQKGGKYVFFVRPSTNKIEIANTIAKIYGVTVKTVNISKLPEKTRLVKRGKLLVKRSLATKAIITLKKGQTIDFTKIKDLK